MAVVKNTTENEFQESLTIPASGGTQVLTYAFDSNNDGAVSSVVIIGDNADAEPITMSKKNIQAFLLKSDTLHDLVSLINEGHADLLVGIAAGGSGNEVDITITNNNAEIFTGSGFVKFYPRTGILHT